MEGGAAFKGKFKVGETGRSRHFTFFPITRHCPLRRPSMLDMPVASDTLSIVR